MYRSFKVSRSPSYEVVAVPEHLSGRLLVSALAVPVFLALVAAGCGAGGSPGSQVAQLGGTTAQPAASSSSDAGGSPSSRSPTSQPRAFSRCVRSHLVPRFPDPDSSGVWPKSRVELVAGNPSFQAATHACGLLLPYGGPGVPPSPAVVQQIRTDMTKFGHREPASTRTRRRSAPRFTTCDHVFPASIGIPWGP